MRRRFTYRGISTFLFSQALSGVKFDFDPFSSRLACSGPNNEVVFMCLNHSRSWSGESVPLPHDSYLGMDGLYKNKRSK